MTVRVATEISADRLFDYAVPNTLAPRIRVGQRVRVPFGGRTADAYVVEIEGAEDRSQESGDGRRGEDRAFSDPQPLTPDSSFGLPLFSSTPEFPTASHRLRPILAIEDDVPFLSPPLIALARWMADYYCAPFELTLRCALPAAVRNSGMKAKEQLYVTPCEGAFDLTKRQTDLLENLRRVGGGWLHALTREFACTAQTLKALAGKGAAAIEKRPMRRDPLANRKILPSRPMPLMPEQATALAQILKLAESEARAGGADGPSAIQPDKLADEAVRAPSLDGAVRAPDLFPGTIHTQPGTEKYWHARHYLPHFDRAHLVQAVSFRLADSLPAAVLRQFKAELHVTAELLPDNPRAAELRHRIERFTDEGHGSCLLRNTEAASIVEHALKHEAGIRYRLLEWCVMPNHVHVLIECLPGQSLSAILKSWKSFTSHQINKKLGLTGTFWQEEYHDRYIRDAAHFEAVRAYIRENPVKASLVADAAGWRFGSAWAGGADVPSAIQSDKLADEAVRAPNVQPCPAQAGGDARAPDSPPKPILLFGVTGSGKTEVYLQAIARMLEQGRGAIVLVPEIALTPQTVQRFASRFGGCIAVLHSALSDGERFDEWHRIRTGEAVVVVGPRSAVFAPVKNLGLIVVDEEHEPSYKQDENPRYNARDVAVMRGYLEKCAVVLGTATPSMETWLNAGKSKYALAQLTCRVSGRPMPCVQVVDMRLETAQAGHVQIFSGQLLEALKLRLERGEQSILFLNRRGYANALVCPKCGYTSACAECSVAHTYHRADSCLRCHICGGWKPVPDVCPECGDPAFKYAGFGTQRVELALGKCFPQARVLRMDADVTARKHSHDELLSIFKSGRADILIGTQMIAKGLDFPNVTLVGVLSADMSLHLPDFRAAERTYQLLAQVSGRAGRADLPGEVFVQTYSPEHPAVRAAASDEGFEPFAALELAERKKGGYPPYSHLVCLTFKGESEDKVRFCAEAYARELERMTGRAPQNVTRPPVQVSGACPAPLAKAKGRYRYQILLRAPSTRAMTLPLRDVMGKKNLPPGVSVAVDVDALNIM